MISRARFERSVKFCVPGRCSELSPTRKAQPSPKTSVKLVWVPHQIRELRSRAKRLSHVATTLNLRLSAQSSQLAELPECHSMLNVLRY